MGFFNTIFLMLCIANLAIALPAPLPAAVSSVSKSAQPATGNKPTAVASSQATKSQVTTSFKASAAPLTTVTPSPTKSGSNARVQQAGQSSSVSENPTFKYTLVTSTVKVTQSAYVTTVTVTKGSITSTVVKITSTPVTSTVAATSTASPATSGTFKPANPATLNEFQKTAVYQHNIHRVNHTVANLTYSTTLEQSAAKLASTCKYGHNITIDGGGYGQNIAAYGSTDADRYNATTMLGWATTDGWYNSELPYFNGLYGQANPQQNSDFEKWAHFTQIVWNKTTTVGCATQYCAAGTIYPFPSWYSVCNYGKYGNVLGQFGKQVNQPIGLPTVSVPIG